MKYDSTELSVPHFSKRESLKSLLFAVKNVEQCGILVRAKAGSVFMGYGSAGKGTQNNPCSDMITKLD